MQIRPFQPSDAQAIFDLRQETIAKVNAQDYSPAIIEDWLTTRAVEDFRQLKTGHKCLVAVIDNQPVGFCEYRLNEKEGEIYRMYIDHTKIKQGIGSKLLAKAEAELIRLGCSKITVESSITARKFYEKKGYKLVEKVIRNYNKLDMEVYLLEKNTWSKLTADQKDRGVCIWRQMTVKLN